MKRLAFALCAVVLFAVVPPGLAQVAVDRNDLLQKVYKDSSIYKPGSEALRSIIPIPNAQVLRYAKGRMGTLVGNGQCTALVEAALRAAGARVPGNYVWGTPINYRGVLPGDVLQFEAVLFRGGAGGNYPHHTAIVLGVKGGVVTLIHQNFGTKNPNQQPVVEDSRVVTTDIHLDQLTHGTLKAYRPMR